MPRDRFSLAVSLTLLVCVVLAALPLSSQISPKHAASSSLTSSPSTQPLQPLFLPAVAYGCPYESVFAVSDVNGDGKLDILCSGSVLLGNGDGTFNSPSSTYYVGGRSLAIADVNLDGKPDIVAVSDDIPAINYQCGLAIMLGNGDGTFQSPIYLPVFGTDPFSVAVADLNGDGKPDAVTSTYFGGISVALGNGDGTFQPAVLYSPGGASLQSVVIADVNGDHIPDLLAVDICGMLYNCYPDPSGTVSVLLGNGDGTFQGPVVYASGGNGGPWNDSWPLAVGILRGNSVPDLAVANPGSSSVAVLQGNGDGTFHPAVSYSTGAGAPVSTVIADVNGDNVPDLAVLNYCVATVSPGSCSGSQGSLGVLVGNGDGTFQNARIYDVGGPFASGLAIADLNGDGKPDAVVSAGTVNVLINDTGAAPPRVTVKASPSPSVFWQPVTLTTTLTSSVTPPTGTVNFFIDSAQIGSAAIANGTASFSLPLRAGSHTIRAVYPGSGSLYGNTSGVKNQSVNLASTTVSVASSADPCARSKPISYKAIVSSDYGGTATGSVVFTTALQTLGTATLNGNQAVLSTTSFATDGAYPIVATYTGDMNNAGSASSAMIQYVDNITSRTVLTSSGPVATVGQPVTFEALVTPANGSVPDGEIVSFYYHTTTLLGTAATVGGKASFTTSSIPAGNWTVKAVYSGDGSYLSSFGTVKETINSYATTTTLTSAPNPSAFKQPVTLTASVTSAGPEVPAGTVIFREGTNSIGNAKLVNGVATLVKQALSSGVHSITATYEGDAQSAKSTSSVLQQVVN